MSSGLAVVCWRHLAAAMGQASHAEREESGAHRRPGLPPFLPRTWVRAPPPLRKPIRDSVASPRSSSMWRIGGRGHCLLTYPSFSTSHAFSVAPQCPGKEHTHAGHKAGLLASPQLPCASAEPRAASGASHSQNLSSGLCTGCSLHLQHPSPSFPNISLTPPLGLGVDASSRTPP